MDFFLSKKVIGGLFFLVLLELAFLFFYHRDKVRHTIPNLNWTNTNIPGNFVSILSFHYLFSLNKGSLETMTVRNTYKGTITEVNNTPGVYIGFPYEKAIDIIQNKGANTVLITKNAYDSLQIVDLNGNSIRFEDLHVGDSVEITEILDLSQRNPFSGQKISISKINQ